MASATLSNGVVSVATKAHVAYCFDSIIENSTGVAPQPSLEIQWTGDKYPLFVTWKKRHGDVGSWKLRGCIGTFAAKELSEGLRDYAVIAAFHDSRFTPISSAELSHLRCDVSLLTQFEPLPAGRLLDWSVGVHGVQIDFDDPVTHRHFSATFLPEVAREQGWSHEETIEELVHKSGYRGAITTQLKQRIRMTRYQSEKASLTYDAYVALRADLVANARNTNGKASINTAASTSHSGHSMTAGPPKRASATVSESDEDDANSPPTVQKKRSKIEATANGNGVHAK